MVLEPSSLLPSGFLSVACGSTSQEFSNLPLLLCEVVKSNVEILLFYLIKLMASEKKKCFIFGLWFCILRQAIPPIPKLTLLCDAMVSTGITNLNVNFGWFCISSLYFCFISILTTCVCLEVFFVCVIFFIFK